MMYGDPPSIVRLNPFAPVGEAPRPHPKAAHPPAVVAQVRHLVETTPFPYQVIAVRTGVNSGTIARWTEKHGWTRPPGAWPRNARPERRYEPVLIGRVLATRLRLQAERLLREIESAPAVDPTALDAALTLLTRAREEQQIRRTRKRRPPDPASVPVKRPRPELDAETRLRVKETRRKAAHKGWVTRWANQEEPPPWTQEGGAGERALAARARRQRQERQRDREFDHNLPSPHLDPKKPAFSVRKWDRRAAALNGWKRRYARMEGRETQGRPRPSSDSP